eukprot:PhF_6_TR8472/c0_g1_i1/m.13240
MLCKQLRFIMVFVQIFGSHGKSSTTSLEPVRSILTCQLTINSEKKHFGVEIQENPKVARTISLLNGDYTLRPDLLELYSTGILARMKNAYTGKALPLDVAVTLHLNASIPANIAMEKPWWMTANQGKQIHNKVKPMANQKGVSVRLNVHGHIQAFVYYHVSQMERA